MSGLCQAPIGQDRPDSEFGLQRAEFECPSETFPKSEGGHYSTPPRLRNGRRTVLLRLRNSRLRNSRALETDKLAYTHTIKYAANLNNIETTGSLTVVWDCLCSALRQACFVVRISCHLT